MIDSTIKTYATRATTRLAFAVAILSMVVAIAPIEARQTTASARGHAVLTGRADAVDGDTLIVGGVHVRLEGIDAPEHDQTCTTASGIPWPCGAEATRVMARLVSGQLVTCEERGLDKYRRILGVCRAGTVELNAEMVRQGLAWAFVRYSRSYVAHEQIARRHKIGIWSGTATPAWDYRAGQWKTAALEAPAGCPIKGNLTAHGRIYHMPWGPWYGKVKMDGNSGKRWFCSEGEAVAAGWRPARSP